MPSFLRVHLGAVSLALVAGLASPVAASAAPSLAPAPTVEEQRLDRAVPREILARSGFDSVAPEFARALGGARGYAQARAVVVREGSALWRRAVDRAQGRGPVTGDLSRGDDRPLYWARLGMTRELRGWEPSFGLSAAQRAALLDELERTSRGQTDIAYPARDKGLKRVLVTGFDPFTLDADIRISNPSGATALALDGTVIETAHGPARIETAVFPVRWQDFTEGSVERALRPHLPRVDLFTTVSQGRVGRFDIERTNGAWRGGFGDNDNIGRTETIPVTDPASQPQWTTTTLPYAAIVAARTGPFPVYDNTSVTEIPAGGTAPVERPDGPTPGSTAREGGGGDYLSNEIAYRATLLRDRLGLHDSLPGGHVHTPVLQFGAGNTTEVTDPEFVGNRERIVGQVREIVRTAVSAS
ncbi:MULTISPECIES: pyroglutamyl peptidase [unclassified Streptomyces]|uniref:pyroglutamyl peptidase n=1 Tax=unclassified Streptomyces TaxID=2593676 RepID=UPI000DDA143C|nr:MULTISPECIES: pyroglutamyl peptidase [unclassified Streptomyces]QZZ27608.1 pyroglutamyl peptidase [Streptomyces sp. ST1015]